MARIKHIAIRTPYPEKTAAFYKDVFGLKEVGQARARVYLSDGYINLAILKSRSGIVGPPPQTRRLDGRLITARPSASNCRSASW